MSLRYWIRWAWCKASWRLRSSRDRSDGARVSLEATDVGLRMDLGGDVADGMVLYTSSVGSTSLGVGGQNVAAASLACEDPAKQAPVVILLCVQLPSPGQWDRFPTI